MAPSTAIETRTLTLPQYRRLRSDLDKLLTKGRTRIEQAVGRELVRTYHAIGQRLLAANLSRHAGYQAATVQRLADDIDVHLRVLQQAMVFARLFPDGSPDTALTWSHYRLMLPLSDAEQRGWYEQQAVVRGWSSRQLAAAIREGRHRERALPPAADGSKRPNKPLRRPSDATYVYAATVERVIDGDTLLVDIDLGFEVSKRQRLRLAGLDTPAIETPKGAEARDFVLHELARVEEIMIKTDKIDLYGRYVAHVFYEPGQSAKARIFAEGRYLNQRLVDEALAEAL